jgi:hypothetical protein
MNAWVECKDWILERKPIRSIVKCCYCDNTAVFVSHEEKLPAYCEHHYPWQKDDDEK